MRKESLLESIIRMLKTADRDTLEFIYFYIRNR